MTKLSSAPTGSIVRFVDGTMGFVQSKIPCIVWFGEGVTSRLEPNETVEIIEDVYDMAKRRLLELRGQT